MDFNKEDSGSAAKAFAAITSHLAQWTEDDDDKDDDYEMYQEDVFLSPMQRQQQKDEHTSRRLSSAFTAAVKTPRGNASDSPGSSTFISPMDPNSATLSSNQFADEEMKEETMTSPPTTYQASLPVATPAQTSYIGQPSSTTTTNTTTNNYTSEMKNTTTIQEETTMQERENYQGFESSSTTSNRNRGNMDGDYKPYHDAVVSLLRSIHYSSAVTTPGIKYTRDLESHLQYIQKIMSSVYARSTQLQQYDDSMVHLKTTRLLENEGNLWSLMYRLFAYDVESARNKGMMMNKSSSSDLLLWTKASNTTIGGERSYYDRERGNIQQWIQMVVEQHSNLDPAAMTRLIAAYLDNDDNQGDTNTTMTIPPLSDLVKRRNIILEWVESCHDRSLPSNLLHDSIDKEKVMWKDSVNFFKRASARNTAVPHLNNGKITSIHPDAPFLARNNKQVNNNTTTRSSFSITNTLTSPTSIPTSISTISPLHGKDEAQETHLLSTCLSLLKAGKLSDALELCTLNGQPWRAASWDGNSAHGLEEVIAQEGGEEEDDSMNGDQVTKKIVRVGNPTRSLWKRNMWSIGRSMHSLLETTNDEQTEGGEVRKKAVMTGSSLVYEAAISSILADDVMAASTNLVLSNNYMDQVWVHYRGVQARFFEQVYSAHNNARRAVSNALDFPLDGTEYQQEEQEQLAATEGLGRFEERSFLASLDQKLSGNMMVEEEEEVWRYGMNAFILGLDDVGSFLHLAAEQILAGVAELDKGDNSGIDLDLMREEDATLLRFTMHVLLFLDSLCCDDPNFEAFKEKSISPHKDELLELYVQHLSVQKPLWHLTTLYASLLPMDNTINVCTEFWSKHVHDEADRRILLNTAREYFSDGLDLVILRRVVQRCILDGDSNNSNPLDEGLQMHSINWLCSFPEHYGDALRFSNTLLRKFLLQIETDSIDDDWTQNSKLQNCKTFVANYVPHDIAMMAVDSIDGEIEDDIRLEGPFVEDNAAEFDALVLFLNAHSQYSKWKEIINNSSPVVEFIGGDDDNEMTLEAKIMNKMATKKYVDKKKEIATSLIDASKSALGLLTSVLAYEDGWLEEVGAFRSSVTNEDDHMSRLADLETLRSKCIPKVTMLAYGVMDETANWMTLFSQDVFDNFNQDQSAEVFRRIEGQFSHESDKSQIDDSNMSSFQPETWYHMARLLSKTVLSAEQCFDKDKMKFFMQCMAETELKLLCLGEVKRM